MTFCCSKQLNRTFLLSCLTQPSLCCAALSITFTSCIPEAHGSHFFLQIHFPGSSPYICLPDDISQLPNQFISISGEPLEYLKNCIFYLSVCVRSFKESDLPDTDNIVPFENTSRLIKSNRSKIKERRAG